MVKIATSKTDSTLKKISDHLKTLELHTLLGEVIPTKRTLPNSNELIHFIPALFIPELNIPIEITVDKERDVEYMRIGFLPMVIVPENLKGSIEVYIDAFLDFHKKWKGKKI